MFSILGILAMLSGIVYAVAHHMNKVARHINKLEGSINKLEGPINKLEGPKISQDGFIKIEDTLEIKVPRIERKKKEYRRIFDDVENPW